MPKQTFTNLDHEKKTRFLNAAYKEFALNEYKSASVSNIVAVLGIAKGSLYQYFENKLDLYDYLIRTAADTKLSFLNEEIEKIEPQNDFFEVLKTLLFSGTLFDLKNPSLSLILMNAMDEKDFPETESPSIRLKNQSEEFMRGFLERGVGAGQLRQETDINLLSHFLNLYTLTIGTYLENKFNFSVRKLLMRPEDKLPFSDKELGEIIDEYIRLFRFGAAPAV